MSRVDIINDIKNKINEKYKQFKCDSKAKANFSEEQTKTSLILPLLSCLGYDISDDNQLVAEDKDKSGAPGIKSSESIDYTLRVDGNDMAIIECKKLGKVLNSNDVQQLFRYYSTKQVHIAILTNGDDYLFFTDGHRENIMDCVPYKSLHISSLNDFSEFAEFSKDNIKSAFIPHVRAVNKDKYNELELEYKNSSLKLKQVTKELDKLKGKEYLTEEQKNKLESLKLYIEENKKLREKVELFKSYFNIKVTKDTKVGYGSEFDRFKVPSDIAKSMVDMIPDDSITLDSKFIDICCRHGEFVIALRDKLFKCPNLIQAIYDDEERLDYIRQNMIYAIMPDKKGLEKVTKALYGTTNIKVNNIVAYNSTAEYRYLIQIYKIYKQTGGRSKYIGEVEKALLEKLGDILFMKFDCVVSNPPYNKGLDLDFVDLGYKMSEKYTVIINPGKWQTAADDYQGRKNAEITYRDFRKLYVPHMSKVVFYPDALDVFQTSQVDGITYFIMDKDVHDSVDITNISYHQPKLNSYNVVRDIRNRESLVNIGQEIIESLGGGYSSYKIENRSKEHKYKVVVNTQIVMCGAGSDARKKDGSVGRLSNMFNSKGQSTFVSEPKIYESVPNGAYGCAFSSDDIDECNSFISWLNCRFTRFFMAINISKLTGILTNDCFRFVPAPPSGKFDHIYTDEELYKAFGLSQKYIDVIEAVVVERKSK